MGRKPNTENVYAFKDVEFMLDDGGFEYRFVVSRIRIKLQEGATPDIRIVIDPAHDPGDPAAPASPANLATIAAMHADLQRYADSKTEAYLSFTIMRNGNIEQKIALKKWVCQASGITSAGAQGSFALEVQIVHPLERADECTTLLTGFSKDDARTDVSESNEFTDIVDATVKTLEKLAKLKRFTTEDAVIETIDPTACLSPNGTTPTGDYSIKSIEAAVNASFQKAADAIRAHLKWDTYGGKYGDWPLPKCFTEDSNILAAVRNTIPDNFLASDITPLEVLKQTVAADFSATLIPVFTAEKLLLRPYTPWADVSITIYDDEISDLTFPGADPAPIAGVLISKTALAAVDYTVYHGTGTSERKYTTAFGFIPEKVQSDKSNAGGRILPLSTPSWFASIGSKEAAILGQESNQEKTEVKGSNTTPANNEYGVSVTAEALSLFSEAQDELDAALVILAHAYFLSIYRGGVQTTVSTKLMISSPDSTAPDGLVLPGYVCRIKTNQDASETDELAGAVYDFYITSVSHTIDVQSARCYTDLTGQHCRQPGGVEGMAMNGTLNPLWIK